MNLQVNCSTPYFNQFCWYLIKTCRFVTFELVETSSTSQALGSGTSGSAVCISACPNFLTPCTLNSWEKYFLHLATILWESVTFLILHYITSRLVPLLKVTDAPIQVPNVLDLIVSFKLLNFSSQICLLFVPELPAYFMFYLVQIVYIALVWILYPQNFSPASFDPKYLNILHQTRVYSA